MIAPRLSSKLILLLVVTLCASTIGLSFSIWQELRTTRAEVEAQSKTISDQYTETYLSQLCRSRATLLDVRLAELQTRLLHDAKALSGLIANRPDEQTIKQAQFGTIDQGANVWFLPTGKPYVLLPSRSGANMRKEPVPDSFTSITSTGPEPGWHPPRIDDFGVRNRWVVDFTAPVSNGRGDHGILGASVALGQLLAELDRSNAVPNSYSALADANGHLLGVSLSQTSTGYSYEQNSELIQDAAIIERTLANLKTGESDLIKVSIHDEQHYLVLRPLASVPWRLVIVIPERSASPVTNNLSQVLQDARQRSLKRIISGQLVTLCIIIGIALGWLARLVEPLEKLATVARLAAQGDFSRRVYLKQNDEVAEVASAFNAMAERVETTVRQLETSNQELATTNQHLSLKLDELQIANRARQREMARREHIEAALRDSEARLTALLRYTPILVTLKDLEGRYLLANARFSRLCNLLPEQIIGRTDRELFEPEVAAMLHNHDGHALKLGDLTPTEEWLPYEGEQRLFLTTRFILNDPLGSPYAIGTTATDITERWQTEQELLDTKANLDRLVEERTMALSAANAALEREISQTQRLVSELEESEQRYSLLLDHASDGVVLTQDDKILLANPAFARLVGVSGQEVPDRAFIDFVSPNFRDKFEMRSRQRLAGDRVDTIDDTRLLDMFGKEIEVEVSSGIVSLHGKPALIAILRDVQQRKQAERALKEANEHLRRLAITDALTGLYNRRHLMQQLELEFARAERYDMPLSVLMIDIDHFKHVNDQFGHQVGDKVLQHVAEILRDRTRNTDFVGRYGGEEFTVILTNTGSQDAAALGESLRSKLESTPCQLDGVNPLRLTISLGCAAIPHTEIHSTDSLLKHADDALYKAKHAGRNQLWLDESGCFTPSAALEPDSPSQPPQASAEP